MMEHVSYREIEQEEDGQRLDNYLMRILKGVPKSHVYRLIRGGEVRVNKKRAKPSSRLVCGDRVRIPPVRVSQEKEVFVGTRLAKQLQDCIIFEDDRLLVVNKPAGIAVHGGSGVNLGVIEALRSIRQDIPYLELVHRLDKETSGCLLIAKKRSMLRSIQALLADRAIRKVYWALLHNRWEDKPVLLVNQPLEKNILQSGERVVKVNPDGKASQTGFKLLENYQHACWVEATPKTGRTHQIRVHSTYLEHPIVGDQKYGGGALAEGLQLNQQRLFLHARAIQFNLNGVDYQFQADLDEKFEHALVVLREGS